MLKSIISKFFKSPKEDWIVHDFSRHEKYATIKVNTVFLGNDPLFLLLAPKVRIKLSGNHQGIIIGTANNSIEVSGNFKGLISAESTIFRKTSRTEAKIFTNKTMIEKGAYFSNLPTQRILQEVLTELNYTSLEVLKDKQIQEIYKEAITS